MASDGDGNGASDYQCLPRRKLQKLCKKHGIPANGTNKSMAEALARKSKEIRDLEELAGGESKPHSDAGEKINDDVLPSMEIRSDPGSFSEMDATDYSRVPDRGMAEGISLRQDNKNRLSMNDDQQTTEPGQSETVLITTEPPPTDSVQTDRSGDNDRIVQDDVAASVAPAETEDSDVNPSLKARNWREMIERATRQARHRDRYKEVPFFKRMLANRSLERARIKRSEVMIQRRMNSFAPPPPPPPPTEERIRPGVAVAAGSNRKISQQEQPVFGRKRFLEKAMAESAKKMSERRAAAPLGNISNRLPDGSNTPGMNNPSFGDGGPRTTTSSSSICGGKVASVHRRHQERFKSGASGKSHQKTVAAASKTAALHRSEILSCRRGM